PSWMHTSGHIHPPLPKHVRLTPRRTPPDGSGWSRAGEWQAARVARAGDPECLAIPHLQGFPNRCPVLPEPSVPHEGRTVADDALRRDVDAQGVGGRRDGIGQEKWTWGVLTPWHRAAPRRGRGVGCRTFQRI